MSVDPPTDLAYGSEVSVVVDEGGFLDMEGHETGLKFIPLVTKMCMLVYTDSALQNADADTYAVGRRTDEIICGLRNALTSGTAQLFKESAKVLRRKQLTSSSEEVRDVSVVQIDLEQKDSWQ